MNTNYLNGYPTQQAYPFPTPIHSQWMASVQRASALTNTGDLGMGSLQPSFAQPKATYAQQHFVNELSKSNSENPIRQSQLAYAKLKDNRAVRRSLAALNVSWWLYMGLNLAGNSGWASNSRVSS